MTHTHTNRRQITPAHKHTLTQTKFTEKSQSDYKRPTPSSCLSPQSGPCPGISDRGLSDRVELVGYPIIECSILVSQHPVCLSLALLPLSLSFSIFSLLYQLFFFCFSFPLCAFRSCASRLVFCRTPHLWWCVCLCVCVCMTNPKVIFKKDLIDRKVIDYLLVSL